MNTKLERHDYDLTKFTFNTEDEKPKVYIELHRSEPNYRRASIKLEQLKKDVKSQSKNTRPRKVFQVILAAYNLVVEALPSIKDVTKEEANLAKSKAILAVDASRYELLNKRSTGAVATRKLEKAAQKNIIDFYKENKSKFNFKDKQSMTFVRDYATELVLQGQAVDKAFSHAYERNKKIVD